MIPCDDDDEFFLEPSMIRTPQYHQLCGHKPQSTSKCDQSENVV